MRLQNLLNLKSYENRLNQLNRYARYAIGSSKIATAKHGDHSIKLRTWSEREFQMRAVESYRAERTTMQWIDEVLNPNDIIWDVGANVGAYALLIGAKIKSNGGHGLVFAFEPESQNFSTLNQNIVLNHLSGIVFPLGIGVGPRQEMCRFELSRFESGAATHTMSTKTQLKTPGHHVQMVMTLSLDQIAAIEGIAFPTAIKIDVDGLEDEIIANAKKTLNNPQLKSLIIELNPSPYTDETIRTIQASGLLEVDREVWQDGCMNLLFQRKA